MRLTHHAKNQFSLALGKWHRLAIVLVEINKYILRIMEVIMLIF